MTNYELWVDAFSYINNIKYYMPKGPILDKILFKKVSEKYIANRFLENWSNDISGKDPIDILDEMIMSYSLYQTKSINTNNKKLIELYGLYIKTLISIKNFIIKKERL